jgi:hypothetical protein
MILISSFLKSALLVRNELRRNLVIMEVTPEMAAQVQTKIRSLEEGK